MSRAGPPEGCAEVDECDAKAESEGGGRRGTGDGADQGRGSGPRTGGERAPSGADPRAGRRSETGRSTDTWGRDRALKTGRDTLTGGPSGGGIYTGQRRISKERTGGEK